MTSLAAGWNWWLDGLTDVVVARRQKALARNRVRVSPSGDAYQVQLRPGRSESESMAFERTAQHEPMQVVPAPIARALAGKSVDLVLAPSDYLIRTLDPLPTESRGYLDGIVQHNLERVTPWHADDVLHTYRITSPDTGDTRLQVTIIATARQLIGHKVAALERLGLANLRLIVPQQGNQGADAVIDIASPDAKAQQRHEARRSAVRHLGVLGGVVIATLAALTWATVKAEERFNTLAIDVSRHRTALLGAPAGSSQARETEAIWSQKRAAVPSVIAIEALSAALPDDTWLTEMRFGEGRVKVTGVSRNVTALIPVIERTPGFADARFFAPTIRLPGNQGNQFHLEARLTAQYPMSPRDAATGNSSKSGALSEPRASGEKVVGSATGKAVP